MLTALTSLCLYHADPSSLGTVRADRFFGMLAAQRLYVGAPSMRDLCTALLKPRADNKNAAALKLQHRVTRAEWIPRQQPYEPSASPDHSSGGGDEGGDCWRLFGRTAQQLDANRSGSEDVALGEYDALVLSDSMCGLPGTPGTLSGQGAAAARALQPHFDLMDSFAPTCVFSCMVALPEVS